MPLIDYVTLDEVKEQLGIKDDQDDARLRKRITAASRQVDEDCGRPYGFSVDAVASPRIFKATHTETLLVDDISTTAGLIVEVGWATSWSLIDPSAYEIRPENCFARAKPGNVLARTTGCWPLWWSPFGQLPNRVRVTSVWGWPAIPQQIPDATLLRATRLAYRKGSPVGVAGFGDLGVVRVSRTDPDYNDLIKDFILDEY